jgi:hypothetical protein
VVAIAANLGFFLAESPAEACHARAGHGFRVHPNCRACEMPVAARPYAEPDPKEQPKSHWAEQLAKLDPADLKVLAEDPVFKDLKARMPQAKLGNTTYYIVERDLRVDEAGLMVYAQERKIMRQRYKLAKQGISLNPAPTGITVALFQGRPVLWEIDATTKRAELKYCFVTGTFTANELAKAKDAMKTAAKSWSDVCAVNFTYVATSDVDNLDSQAPPPAGVTFVISKQTLGNGVIASSFFPYFPKFMRHLFLDDSWFTVAAPFTPEGILRHEIGHILGYRHEHIRSEAPPDCPKENAGPDEDLAPLAAYDPQSVMHYPCGQFMNFPQNLTATDKDGARQCYGSPPGAGTGFALPPGPTLVKPNAVKP